jgi:hypothetical protein
LKDKELAEVERTINHLQTQELELDSKISQVEMEIKVEINF